jgi:hypothetical protein
MEGSLLERGIGFYLDPPKELRLKKNTKIIPHAAGLTAVGGVYVAAGALVAMDGPLPFGDALAVGLLAIPDVAIYAIGYHAADSLLDRVA